MFRDESPQYRFVEISATQRFTAQKRVMQIAVQTGAKPAAHRHAEAMLFSIDNLLGDNSLKRAFQDVFRGYSLEL